MNNNFEQTPINPYTAYEAPAVEQYSPTERAEQKKTAVKSMIFGIISIALSEISAFVLVILIYTAIWGLIAIGNIGAYGDLYTFIGMLVGIFSFALIFSIAGIVFGLIAKNKANSVLKCKPTPGKGFAIAGKISGIVGFICGIIASVYFGVCTFLFVGMALSWL